MDSAGTQSNGLSQGSAVSADGRFVGFVSQATNLVPGDTNGAYDVFVFDRQTSITERVSVDSAGVEGNLGGGYFSLGGAGIPPALSADGRYVAFESESTNLAAGDTNGFADIFLRDRLLGTTELVSLTAAGGLANQRCGRPSISSDARFVVFVSDATNLAPSDTSSIRDTFLRDRVNGTTECISLNPLGVGGNNGSGFSTAAAVSSDGRYVAFESYASDLVPGDSNGAADIFVRDRQNGTTELASVDSTGVQGASSSTGPCRLTPDGRYVLFYSSATNLVPGDTNAVIDVFLRDRQLGTTERVSVDSSGSQADASSFTGAISADGRFVSFISSGTNLVPGDTNSGTDSFLRDRQFGTTECTSVRPDGTPGDANTHGPGGAISADGRIVVFASSESDLVAGDTNGVGDVFVRDRGVPPGTAFCAGDGSAGACPCGNSGAARRGCENSASTGGAVLTAAGAASLSADTLVLTSSGELPSVLSIFLQGTTSIAPATFGDGLRCTGGTLKRLYMANAALGVVRAPPAGGISVSARSAALGDTIVAGTTRHYQTYYRDPQLAFCANPPGNSWNVSSGLSIVWDP